MWPKWINFKGMTQQGDRALIGGSSKVHDTTERMCLKIQSPSFGEWVACGRTIQANSCSFATGGDVSVGAIYELFNGIVMKSRPHFGLPTAIEIFYGCLKPGLARWGKYRRDAKTQAQPHHPSYHIRVHVRPLKTGVVVELNVGGKSYLAPMRNQPLNHYFSGDGGHNPCSGQPSVKGDTGEDLHLAASLHGQSFHDVETVQFRFTARNVWKVPSARRWRSPDTLATIQRPPSFENASNGADRWRSLDASVDHLSMNCSSTELAKIARGFEFSSYSQHLVFHFMIRSVHRSLASAGSIAPVHSVKSTPLSSPNPQLDSCETNIKSPCHCAHGNTVSDGGHHFPALLLFCFFRVMVSLS